MSTAKPRTKSRHSTRAKKYSRWGWPIIGLAAVAMVVIIAVAAIVLFRPAPGPSASPISRVGTQDYHSLALASGNPNVVLFGHHGGILRSSDGGQSWSPVPGLGQDAMNLAVGHQSPQVMYLAGHNVFMRSEDGGQTWKNVANNLPGLDLHWFAMNPDDPGKLYTNAVGFGLYTSSDGGETWAPWGLQVPGSGSVSALAVLGGDPQNVLAGTEEGVLLYSHDGGATWEEVGRMDSMPMAFALNRDTQAIYLGTMKGVYRSADSGSTWARLTLDTTVVTLAAGGSTPERVLVVNNKGEVFRSDDGGQTW